MTARLKLNRLSVHRGAFIMYDELFHDGVNIIHGDNGSGKSTIADFIYFALGGDLREWRREAALAHFVLAEIAAQDAVLTIKRVISDSGARPMEIFFGPYVEAVASDVTRWETFPYSRPDSGYSFSQVLFKAIGIPEAISDGVSNITMHQLFRILYSDQLTPVQRIFRVERFDTWQTKQAVGDLLCGLGGYDLYALQLFHRDLLKEYNDVSDRLKSLITVASSYGDKILAEHLAAAIEGSLKERDELQQRLLTLIEQADGSPAHEANKVIGRQRKDLANARLAASELSEKVQILEDEIDDADQFIDHLENSVREFEDASSTFSALGAVRFEFCPSCFTALKDRAQDHQGECHLCGSSVVHEHDEARALALKLDLQMQISESRQLQSDRDRRLVALKNELRAANTKLRSAVAANELARSSAASQLETAIADASRRIGYLDHEIEQLQQREALAQEIAQVSEEKASLNARISEMADRIKASESTQKRRRSVAYTAISDNAKGLLGQDLAEHSDFGHIDSLTFSFSEDWIAINGDKNRVGSASGMVILKNSFLFGLFVAALNDDEFNLPRFILMDNIEDKGMVQERSWNFQRLIIRASKATTRPHQIIFTTSKIAPELADTPLVIGGKYTRSRHSLNIRSS